MHSGKHSGMHSDMHWQIATIVQWQTEAQTQALTFTFCHCATLKPYAQIQKFFSLSRPGGGESGIFWFSFILSLNTSALDHSAAATLYEFITDISLIY